MATISIHVTLEEGESVMAGECPVCGWKHEVIMTVGDYEREDACQSLEWRHEATGCTHKKIDFNEHDST
jgi:hypothetical protein